MKYHVKLNQADGTLAIYEVTGSVLCVDSLRVGYQSTIDAVRKDILSTGILVAHRFVFSSGEAVWQSQGRDWPASKFDSVLTIPALLESLRTVPDE